jgi:hypothetical protein
VLPTQETRLIQTTDRTRPRHQRTPPIQTCDKSAQPPRQNRLNPEYWNVSDKPTIRDQPTDRTRTRWNSSYATNRNGLTQENGKAQNNQPNRLNQSDSSSSRYQQTQPVQTNRSIHSNLQNRPDYWPTDRPIEAAGSCSTDRYNLTFQCQNFAQKFKASSLPLNRTPHVERGYSVLFSIC